MWHSAGRRFLLIYSRIPLLCVSRSRGRLRAIGSAAQFITSHSLSSRPNSITKISFYSGRRGASECRSRGHPVGADKLLASFKCGGPIQSGDPEQRIRTSASADRDP